eukprot:COSAG02_NODE_64663_length_260_cov_0.608696_1_plen_33_part_10
MTLRLAWSSASSELWICSPQCVLTVHVGIFTDP